MLNAHLRDAEQAILEKKGMEKLGRKAKADLKLFILKKLRRQLMPYLATPWGLWALWGPLVLGRVLIYALDSCPECGQRPGL